MKKLLTSCFGLGYLPIAPGTWGSMPVAAFFWLMCYQGVSVIMVSVVMGVIVLAGSIICVLFGPEAIEATGKKDPSEVVSDEVAGQAVAFIGACASGAGSVAIVTTAGFLLFRFFDILKPFPCRRLEKLPKGFGILADDLMAGVYAAIVLQIGIRFWLTG
jgi:phosphatidylglycerophosphatase A